MIGKSRAPLSCEQIQAWLQSFPLPEVVRYWSISQLRNAFDAHDYVYEMVGEEVAAVIFFHRLDPEVYEVLFLATAPQHRRRGAMRDLFQRLVQRIQPPSQIWLECREDNPSARSLYSNLGFREAGRRPAYYGDGTAAILFNL